MERIFLTAAGQYEQSGAIDDLLAGRHFPHASTLEADVARDENDTVTLTYRNNPETMPSWKQAQAENNTFDMTAEEWAGEGGGGYIYDFNNRMPCHVVEIVWRVGSSDAVIASASGVIILGAQGFDSDAVRDGLNEIEVKGGDALFYLSENEMPDATFILRGLEVVEEQRGKGVGADLVKRILEDVTKECGGTVPVTIADYEELYDEAIVDNFTASAKKRNDALKNAAIIIPGAIPCDCEGCMPRDNEPADEAPTLESAADLRIAYGYSARNVHYDNALTVDDMLIHAKEALTADTDRQVEVRRLLVAMAMFIALDQREDWHNKSAKLLEAVRLLDQSDYPEKKCERELKHEPGSPNPNEDLVTAVHNRLMPILLMTKGASHEVKTGDVLDAMLTESAAEAVVAFLPEAKEELEFENLPLMQTAIGLMKANKMMENFIAQESNS